MTEIIQFPVASPITPEVTEPEEDPSEYIYTCADCKCRTWKIILDGTIECANCENAVPATDEKLNGEWRQTADRSPKAEDDDANCIDVKNFNDSKFARRHVLKRITDMEKDDKVAVMLGFHLDGSTFTWADVETEEQKQWVIRHLNDYLEHWKKTSLSK